MIGIINTGEHEGGRHVYRLQINNELITVFTHARKDGLAACLREAASAVEAARYEEWVDHLRKMT